jgi:hypothetical protein
MSKADDLSEARALVGGYVEEDAKGRRRSKYLMPGSDEERSARQALARVLRGSDPLERQLRDSLAGLFDPDPPAWEQRKIRIVSRRQGGKTDHVRNTQIAEYIWFEVKGGERVTAAIEGAAEKFAISADMTTKIWGGYRPLMEQLYGPLRQGRR